MKSLDGYSEFFPREPYGGVLLGLIRAFSGDAFLVFTPINLHFLEIGAAQVTINEQKIKIWAARDQEP
jgi:hypothetical protein